MKLVIADASYLKDSISIIADLVNEATFKFSQDGIEIIAMDPANVAMVIFRLLSSGFTEYDIQKDAKAGVNLQSLKQILRRASPADVLTLELGTDNKLKIQLRAATVRTFSLPVIEIEEKEQRIPNLQFPLTVTLPAQTLNDAITDADIVAESVSLVCEPELFAVHAQGDHSNANIEMKASDSVRIQSTTQANVKAKYSIEYLKKMISGGKLAELVDVQFSQDYPLRLDYKLVDRLSLSFILAPRVEND